MIPVKALNGGFNGVGLVADKKRAIALGGQYDRYFPRPDYSDPYLSYMGTNEQTLQRFIPQMVKTYNSDCAQISILLKKENLKSTLENIFNFVYKHIQYKQDSPVCEEIRRPARSWYDRFSGVDCDCYAVFISSILYCLRIPHSVRMTMYNPKRGYQHVYVVVPKTTNANLNNRNGYYAIDPVLDHFDEEKTPIYKKLDQVILGGVNQSGLSGVPIRSLTGNEPNFARRSDLVFDEVYYNPGMGQWALKGLDGAFYINGDPNKRYVCGVDGVDGWISTALKFGKKIVKGVKKGVKKVRTTISNARKYVAQKKEEAQNAVDDVKNDIAEAKGSVQSSIADVAAIKADLINTANSTVQSLDLTKTALNNQITNSNNAIVTSLQAVSDGTKKQISKVINAVAPKINELAKSTTSISELEKAAKAEIADVRSLVAGSQYINNEIKKTQAEQTSRFKGMQYILVGVAVLVVFSMFIKR